MQVFSTNGAEPSNDQLELWDICREMCFRIAWKPYMYSQTLPHLLGGVTAPSLVVWGGEDEIVPLECAAAYAAAYGEHLGALDAYVGDAMTSVPEKARVLVTAHDAFRYFARAYDVEVLGIQGLSTESEAGLERTIAYFRSLLDTRRA